MKKTGAHKFEGFHGKAVGQGAAMDLGPVKSKGMSGCKTCGDLTNRAGGSNLGPYTSAGKGSSKGK
jgi:hypothetical protein